MKITSYVALSLTILLNQTSPIFSQESLKWEFGATLQFNNPMIHTQTSTFNPQYQRLLLNQHGSMPTSIDFQLLKHQNKFIRHGLRVGGLILGGDYIFDVLPPSGVMVLPERLNMYSMAFLHLSASYQLQADLINSLEKFILKVEPNKNKRRVTILGSIGAGAITRLHQGDRPNEKLGFTPSIAFAPNGDVSKVQEDYYNKAAINGVLNADLIIQIRTWKRISLNFSFSRIMPFGPPLYEVKQEFSYNNQVITSAVSNGGAPMYAARFGINYHFEKFPFSKSSKKK